MRQLENAIERAIVLADETTLEVDNFDFKDGFGAQPTDTNDDTEVFSLKTARAKLEDRMIRKALAATNGNRTHAANMLEISHPSLLSKMKQYGIK